MTTPLVIHEIAMPLALQMLEQESKAVLVEQTQEGYDLSQLDVNGTKTLRFLVRNGLPKVDSKKGRW